MIDVLILEKLDLILQELEKNRIEIKTYNKMQDEIYSQSEAIKVYQNLINKIMEGTEL